MDKLLPTLFLGVVDTDPYIAATALSHIGWENISPSRDETKELEIGKYYDQALILGSENSYTHIMLASLDVMGGLRTKS